MPYVASIGTYLPCWGTPLQRVVGDDEDAVTMAHDMAWDYELGVVAPAGFALRVRRYLHESPATEEHLAMVAAENHRQGVHNPKARLCFEITMEPALNAPIRAAKQALAMAGMTPSDVDVAEVHDLPANPRGGLKAKGHPPGASGVAECVELFQQSRGDAVDQIDGARIALAHNIGGPTAVSAVRLLEGSGGLN